MSDEEVLAELRAIRKLVEAQSTAKVPGPSDTALAATYQVAARAFGVESQLIWSRTSLFIALNSLVVAGLQLVKHPASPVLVVVPAVGLAYVILWHLSLERAWEYHRMYVETMRAQEAALGLQQLGVFSRGKVSAEADSGTRLGGLRARTFARVTTALFGLAYGVLLLLAVLRWAGVC